MNTYQPTSLATALLSDEALNHEHLGYLHARAQNKAHDCVLGVFVEEAEERGINKAYIARRLGKRPEVVGRCLTAPGNWTLDTLAELLGSMGYDVEIQARPFSNPVLPNRIHEMVIPAAALASTPPSYAYVSGAIITTSGLVGTGNVKLASTS
jgi:hypothetical protein